MRRAPLLFTPKRRPPSLRLSPSLVAVAACPFGPSVLRRPFVVWPCTKKAMKSRYLSRLLRIPLLLFASRCAEHRREKERESERRKKPFLPLAHSSFIHRRVEYTFRNCRPPVRFRSFVYSYVQRRRRRRRRQEHLLARITSRFPRRHAPLPPSLCHCLRRRASSLSS